MIPGQGSMLSELIISNLDKLKVLECGRNQLTSLDIRNNLELETLNLDSIPSLQEVCV